LIDDMEQIITIEKLFLERAGFTVTAETDAEKALSLFRQNPRRFSVVITDMTMPKMNGLNVAREMHALNPQLPIILCTGHGDAVLDGNLRDAGIISVLQKPVSRNELVKTIRDIVGAG
jgi:two-component system, cell cycle sensor histidine kinase and response regulator CckA